MTDRLPPSNDEIRALIGRIVDATLAAHPAGATSPVPATASGGAPVARGANGSPPAPGAPAGTGAPSATAATSATPGGRAVIAVGGDHGGFALKDEIAKMLRDAAYEIIDCGTDGPAAVDYPDIAHAVARHVADGTARYGIVVDGAGIGSCMAANKVPGIRASLCYDISTARNAREHNHANVLTLGAGLIGQALAKEIVRTWLGTEWGPGRHAARVDKISGIEARYLTSAAQEGPR